MIEPPVGRAGRVQSGQVKQWWLTVRVPDDTPAGRYRMSLTVRPQNAPPTVMEWRLLVLPFQLARPADKHWGTWLDSFPPVGGLIGHVGKGAESLRGRLGIHTHCSGAARVAQSRIIA